MDLQELDGQQLRLLYSRSLLIGLWVFVILVIRKLKAVTCTCMRSACRVSIDCSVDRCISVIENATVWTDALLPSSSVIKNATVCELMWSAPTRRQVTCM